MPCCNLDEVKGKFDIQHSCFNSQKNVYSVQGIYNRTPTTLAGRVFRLFQRLELVEKIAEIADESFHLWGTVLQRYTTVMVYQTLRNLHHAAHDIEHLLHTFCFLGDLSRLITGKFLEYHQHEGRTQLDYLHSVARVCHAMNHFLASAAFLSELKLCQFGRLEKIFKYASAFSAVGYALWTISLIWQHQRKKTDDQWASDLGIHLAGCVFEAIPLAKTVSLFASHATVINKIAAVAGIIHAWCVVQRLMPRDRENFKFEFPI